jgi:MFS family permease
MDEITVDDAFRRIGQFGRIQKLYFVIIGTVSFITALHAFSTTFVDFTPSWSCLENGKGGDDTSTNWCPRLNDGSVHCAVQYGKDSPKTTVTEWQLICDKSHWARLPQSLYFAGTALSSLTMGGFGDKHGRKLLTMLCIGLSVLFSGLSAVAVNVYMYIAMRFCLGFAIQGIILGFVVWIFEVLGPDKRSQLQAMTTFFLVVGGMLLPGMSLLLPNWRHFLIVSAIISVLPLIFSSFIPESPSWLLVTGHKEEAKLVLHKIAKGNRTILPEEVELKTSEDKPQDRKGFFALFSFPEIARRSIIQSVCWFVLCSTFYGVTYALGDSLGGNRYVNFFFGVSVEAPAVFLSLFIADRYGRCSGMSGLLIGSGICLVGSILGSASLKAAFPDLSTLIRVSLAILGRLCNSAAFTIAYFYAAELFPTEVRNVGLGVVSVGSRLGGIVSPFVLYVENIGIPIFLMGVLSVCAGVLSLRLPETKGQPTPETLEELRSRSAVEQSYHESRVIVS